MAIVKVVGIETEYGIVLRGSGESNPIAASSVLINAYVQELQQSPAPGGERIEWDFEDESPGKDARGFAREGAMPPEVETHLVNTVLTNGARYYVDHAHPEFSTPECADALELVRYDKAGEVILARSMDAAARSLPTGQGIVVYKNNSDGKGNSYGCHENYMMDRAVPFGRIVRHVMPHFVTRQIYCGAGKVGCETTSPNDRTVTFQLSQRADFFEEEVGLETTLKRPIVNTRDEPHADAQKYRRLHVIVGDANMAEVSTFLKIGTTAIVLSMIEDDWFGDRELSLAAPVQSIRRDLPRPVLERTAVDGRRLDHDRDRDPMGAARPGAQIRRGSWARVRQPGSRHRDPAPVGGHAHRAGERSRERSPTSSTGSAKYRLLEGYRDRHSLEWDDPRLAAMDLQYHDVRPEKSLHARMSMERLTTDESVMEAITEPPRDTRAYFRGKCLQKWASWVAAANWDSLVFDLGSDPLRRVPMMEPLKGTAEFVDRLLEECATPAELIERLGA